MRFQNAENKAGGKSLTEWRRFGISFAVYFKRGGRNKFRFIIPLSPEWWRKQLYLMDQGVIQYENNSKSNKL